MLFIKFRFNCALLLIFARKNVIIARVIVHFLIFFPNISCIQHALIPNNVLQEILHVVLQVILRHHFTSKKPIMRQITPVFRPFSIRINVFMFKKSFGTYSAKAFFHLSYFGLFIQLPSIHPSLQALFQPYF